MTKYEWESELKKNIHRLPADEIKRVMEYYDELFADKIEGGYRETEIISQFGNPADVADKIISEYDGELAEDKKEHVPVYESKQKEEKPSEEKPEKKIEEKPEEKTEVKEEKQGRRLNTSALVLFIVLNVLTVFAFFIVLGALWIAVGAVTVGGVACIGGGVLRAVFSLFEVFGGHVAAGFAQVGVCIAAVGIGIVLVSVIAKIFKLYGKICIKIFGAIGNWICPKEKAHD